MMYADNEYKWVAVLNRKAPLPQLLNAVGHLALGMRSQCKEEAAGFFHDYEGADGRLMSTVSHWPVIVLQANNANQLRTLRAAALDAGLPCQAFVDAMIGQSAEEQIRKTRATDDSTAAVRRGLPVRQGRGTAGAGEKVLAVPSSFDRLLRW